MSASLRVTFSILVFGAISLFAFATVASANHVWGNTAGAYHWARTTPSFTLQLGDNVTSAWDSYLRTASTDWSTSAVLDTQVVSGQGGRNCKATTGRAEICNARYGSSGWLGLAQIYISGNHITKALVKMNDTYFNTSTYNKPAWRMMVMCQEIGHIFGLNHQDEGFNNLNLGTCMDYTNDPARNDGAGNNLHPNAHDYTVLEQIYAHLDTTTTVMQSSSSSNARGLALGQLGDNPSDWGQEISRSANGHASVFSKKVGNEQVLTHVFWAEPQEHEEHD